MLTNISHRLVPSVALLGSLTLLPACAGQRLTQSGFLQDYEQLQRGESQGRNVRVFRASALPLSGGYRAVIIEPVAWRPVAGSPARDPSRIAKLQARFQAALRKELIESGRFAEAIEPGPSVALVRAAITDTDRANAGANIAVQGAMFALGLPFLLRPDNGGASSELEVLDSRSGQRLAAMQNYDNGQFWHVAGSYDAYGHANRHFRLAARRLGRQLDQLSVGASAQAGNGQILAAAAGRTPR